MTSNFIWRDPIDPNTYHVGYERPWRYKDGIRCAVENEYSILVSLHEDILSDLLGPDSWSRIREHIEEQPQKVNLSLSLL